MCRTNNRARSVESAVLRTFVDAACGHQLQAMRCKHVGRTESFQAASMHGPTKCDIISRTLCLLFREEAGYPWSYCFLQLQMTLEEELQGPLHELLLSACEVKADTWPQVAAAQCAAAVSPTVPPGKFDSAISSAAEAASTSAEPTGATAKSAQPVDDSSTDTNSSRYSIFGGGSLWQVDPLGSWELATTAGRGPGFSRAHRMPSISDNHRRGVVEGTTGSSVEGVRHPDQQHRGSVYHSSPSFSMQSYTRSSTAGQGGGLRIGRRTTSMTGAAMLQRQQQWKEEYLHQPQQVTQSQAQLLMFVGAFLARRQQYPLMLQVCPMRIRLHLGCCPGGFSRFENLQDCSMCL